MLAANRAAASVGWNKSQNMYCLRSEQRLAVALQIPSAFSAPCPQQAVSTFLKSAMQGKHHSHVIVCYLHGSKGNEI